MNLSCLTACVLMATLASGALAGRETTGSPPMTPMTFATCATDKDELYWGLVMVESLREFGGRFADAPVRFYLDDQSPELDTMYVPNRERLKIQIRHSRTPESMRGVIYAQKVYAAAVAEKDATTDSEILVWLDPDVVFVREPTVFMLDSTVVLGYRPVQLLNISSRFDQPPNEFWRRLYTLLQVKESSIFPMTTTADLVEIRPHVNAGMVILRPEQGILRSWPTALEKLWSDSSIHALCAGDRRHAIFLHQAALAGVVMASLPREQMKDLPPTYNYAVMFADRLPVERRVGSLDNLVMLRHDLAFSDPERRGKVADSSRIWQWLEKRWPR